MEGGTPMEDSVRQALIQKNQRLIDMVIERAKRDFPEDIVLVALTGSFLTGDFHQKSDLDLIIVNETPRGWDIAASFILEDVGYDIYCTPWSPRLEAQSLLESPMAGHLLDMEVVYCKGPEYMEKLMAYRQRALDLLSKPVGPECIGRAWKNIEAAKRDYADAMLSQETGAVRHAAGRVLYEAVNALINLNNTYMKRGVKRYLETVLALEHRPENLEEMYLSVVRARTAEELRGAAGRLLAALVQLHGDMVKAYVPAPSPTYENLKGTYEELWSNCRNKVLASALAGDISYAFHAALGAQEFLDEMADMLGTPRFDLMGRFDADNPAAFRDAFLAASDEYAAVYARAGRKIARYDSFGALYPDFMAGRVGL